MIDTGGTISTAPDFPMGSIIDCAATGPITLATTWSVSHRNIVMNWNGCHVNYNQDTGSAAFVLGKNLTGAVTCAGTARP